MLTLTRRPHEEIVIDDGRVVIEVLEIRGNKVKLGFNAGRDIAIHRREVYDREAEKQGAGRHADAAR